MSMGPVFLIQLALAAWSPGSWLGNQSPTVDSNLLAFMEARHQSFPCLHLGELIPELMGKRCRFGPEGSGLGIAGVLDALEPAFPFHIWPLLRAFLS